MTERFVVGEVHGYRNSGGGAGNPGIGVVVLDTADCYRLVQEFSSEHRVGRRHVDAVAHARQAARDLADRLNLEHG